MLLVSRKNDMPPTSGKPENRKNQRIKLQIPVRFMRQPLDISDDTESFYISSMTELSLTGAFIQTSAPFEAGTLLDINFEIPANRYQLAKIRALAEVAWCRNEPVAMNPDRQREKEPEMGVGLRFVMLTQEEKNLLETFVDRINP